MSLKTFFIGLILVLLTSCGIKYIAPVTPISLASDRKAAIQQHLKETMALDSAVYTDIAWGQTKTIKPISYKDLDSLYAIKYKLEREGKRDLELEDKIKIQRQIALNDTAQILYQEDHLFGILKDGKLSVYSAIFETTKDHVIRNTKINDSQEVDPKLIEEYKQYTFEESFLNPGLGKIIQEDNFYRKFKAFEYSLNGSTRDAFLNHTLQVMQSANRARTLNTIELLKQFVAHECHGYLTVINAKFESMEEVVTKIDDKAQVTGYRIVYSYQLKQNDMLTTYRYFIELSPYYAVMKKALI